LFFIGIGCRYYGYYRMGIRENLINFVYRKATTPWPGRRMLTSFAPLFFLSLIIFIIFFSKKERNHSRRYRYIVCLKDIQVALKYKELWQAEQVFRDKNFLGNLCRYEVTQLLFLKVLNFSQIDGMCCLGDCQDTRLAPL